MLISDWSSDVCSSDLDLDVGAIELLDDAVAGDVFLFLDQEYSVLEVDGVRVVFLLQRRIYAAPFGKGPETADADADFLAVALAELARQAEQVDRLLQGDRVHALAGAQRSEEHTSELQSLMRISYAVFCL